MKNAQSGGYIGLLVVLIGVVLSVLLFVHFYLTPGAPGTSSATSTKVNDYQQLIDSTQKLQQSMNAANQKEANLMKQY